MSRVVLVEASIFQLEVGVLRKDLNGTHSKDDNDDLAILTHNRVYEVVAIDNCANVPTSFFFVFVLGFHFASVSPQARAVVSLSRRRPWLSRSQHEVFRTQ